MSMYAQAFIPGSGAACEEDSEDEECSETETMDSLNEIVFPDTDTPEDPKCESPQDQLLVKFAQQFMAAKEIQKPTGETQTKRVPKVPENKKPTAPSKPSAVLPQFVSCL